MQSLLASHFRAAVSLLAVSAFFAGLDLVTAAPASTNDTCDSAIRVPGSGPFPYLTPVFDISNATTNDDPVLTATNECLVGNMDVTNSVWFKFTPTVSGHYGFSVGVDTATTIDDTVLAIYTAPGCGGPYTPFACNDDSGSELHAGLLASNLVAGTTYYILAWVGPVEVLAGQALDLQLRVSKPAVPANDGCAGVFTIPGNGPFPFLTPTNDTTYASEDGDPPGPDCADTFYRSLWYKFTPTLSGTYIFSTGSDTATSVAQTVMALYQNSGGCGSPFTMVGCNGNGLAKAALTISVTANFTYYLVVWDYNPDVVIGETSLQVRVGAPDKPSAVTLPAASVTSTSATLRAQVNANGVQSRFWFEWGSTDTYTSTNTARLLNAGFATLITNATIIGFLPGATYHYRVVATNMMGKTYGADQIFRWSNTPPTIDPTLLLFEGNFNVQFPGNVSQLYWVQGSTNLTNWADLGVANDLGSGVYQWQPSPDSIPYNFYRVRTP